MDFDEWRDLPNSSVEVGPDENPTATTDGPHWPVPHDVYVARGDVDRLRLRLRLRLARFDDLLARLGDPESERERELRRSPIMA